MIVLSLLFLSLSSNVVSICFISFSLIEKNQRLKEAKEEAQKEIETYRKQRETQFQEQQKKVY